MVCVHGQVSWCSLQYAAEPSCSTASTILVRPQIVTINDGVDSEYESTCVPGLAELDECSLIKVLDLAGGLTVSIVLQS